MYATPAAVLRFAASVRSKGGQPLKESSGLYAKPSMDVTTLDNSYTVKLQIICSAARIACETFLSFGFLCRYYCIRSVMRTDDCHTGRLFTLAKFSRLDQQMVTPWFNVLVSRLSAPYKTPRNLSPHLSAIISDDSFGSAHNQTIHF